MWSRRDMLTFVCGMKNSITLLTIGVILGFSVTSVFLVLMSSGPTEYDYVNAKGTQIHVRKLYVDREKWMAGQRERRRLMEGHCREQDERGKPDAGYARVIDSANILVDEKNKVVFCAVPQVASTSWIPALVKLAGRVSLRPKGMYTRPQLERLGITALYRYPRARVEDVLRRYRKVLMVRDPLDRLVATYEHTFRPRKTSTEPYQRHYGTKIVERYRTNATGDALRTGSGVTLNEFAQFLVDPEVAERSRYDEMWASYQNICQPCAVRYDHVLKYETLTEDVALALTTLYGVRRTSDLFPDREELWGLREERARRAEAVAELPIDLRVRLKQRYAEDSSMFGYDPHIHPRSRAILSQV